MKIAIVSAVWKRPEVFKLFARGIHKLIESFPSIQFEIIIAGSEGDQSQQMVTSEGFHYIEIANDPLAAKHNSTLKFAKNLKPDYVLCLGSDDIIHPGLFSVYLKEIENRIDFIGLSDFYFYDMENGKTSYWGGYVDERKGIFCGAGALLSKKLLDMWGWKIWENIHNKILDNSLFDKLRITPCKKKTFSLKELGVFALDIKSSTNMTPFELWPNTEIIPRSTITNQFQYLELPNRKIFLTGVARSGTTMLRNLFTAFEDCNVIKDEMSIDNILTQNKGDTVVAKRTQHTVYSHSMLRRSEVNRQINLIKDAKIQIVNIIRDKAEVIGSWYNGWGIPEQGAFDWEMCVPKALKAPIINVYYDQILSDPDVVQKELSEKLGLTIKHLWSEYPKFVPAEMNSKNEYSLRKLGEKHEYNQ